MNIFCPDPCTTCAPVPGSEGIFPNPNAEANPFSNFTSEKPDVVIFNPDLPWVDPKPPLGTFNKQGCISLCVSTVSQEAADICAFNQQVLCLDANCLTCPPADLCQVLPNHPACVIEDFCIQHPDDPGCQQPAQMFYNVSQQCTVACPDGTPFTFIVPSATFLQPSTAAANALAYSYACNMANKQKVCLGELNQPVCCTGQTYPGSIVLTAGFPTTQPFSFAVSSGALPPGLGLSSTSSGGVTRAIIGGITNTVGVYTFGITASHPSGVSVTRQYTITVIGIATSGLAGGTVGTPYSETMASEGPVVSPVWTVVLGSLPTGLSLNAETGQITGTPTTAQTSSFSIRMATLGDICQRDYTVDIAQAQDCPDWQTLVWGPPNETTAGAGTALAFGNFDTVMISVGSPNGDSDTAVADITGSFIYNGSGCNCNLHIDMTGVGDPNFVNGGVQVSTVEGGIIILPNQWTLFGGSSIDQPFSLPDTGGLPFTVQVFAAGDSGEPGDPTINSFGLNAVITNVP